MPIKPENRSLYPRNWQAISRHIRKVRAMGRCECEGECGISHVKVCDQTGSILYDQRCNARNSQPHPITGSQVVLTVAHLDHDPTNNKHDNLRAMCQRCHNRYDAEHRKQTRANG